MSANAVKHENKKRNDFLANYQSLKYSKAGKSNTEVLDIERRCLALKYLSAKAMDSEETASVLFRAGLRNYREEMNKLDYWKHLKRSIGESKDCADWTTGLNDPRIALKFLSPLPCQRNNTLPCKQETIADEHVRNIIEMWKNQSISARPRKVGGKSSRNINASCNSNNASSDTQRNVKIPSAHSEYFNDENNTSNTDYHRPNPYEYHVQPQDSTSDERYNRFNPKIQAKPVSERFKYPRNENRAFGMSNDNPRPPASSREDDLEVPQTKSTPFLTARQELNIQRAKQNRPGQKTLGGKTSVNSQFVCPLKAERERLAQKQGGAEDSAMNSNEEEDERLKNIDPKMVELIRNEIMDIKTSITWDDIAGLKTIKKIIQEVVVFPMLRPDIFTGLRRPPKGILLFGPPGTGKTLIGKCIASQSNSTFFSISASSLTSKWIGEGEKMVRALFAVARVHQPSVVFVDEIDSLLSQRSETEHESSRRLKTEFLVQLDGVATFDDDRILIVGATNRPHELDEAARRRLVKRLYVPLPEYEARAQIVNNLLRSISNDLTAEEVADIAERSEGYSGADMTNLCKEASMGPIRSIPFSQLQNISKEEVRGVTVDDFNEALKNVRPSVSQMDLTVYVDWDKTYGTGTAQIQGCR